MAKKRYHGGKAYGASSKMMGSGGTYTSRKASDAVMKADGGMIHYDMSAPCYCPREVIQKYWPKVRSSAMGHEADLYSGVQKQMNADRNDFAKIYKPGKA